MESRADQRLRLVKEKVKAQAVATVEDNINWLDRNTFDLTTAVAPSSDEDINLLGHTLLYRGGNLLVVGPTGAGKSSLVLQCCIAWSLGQAAFGLLPEGRLKTLYFSGEGTDRNIQRRAQHLVDNMDVRGSWENWDPLFRVCTRSDVVRFEFIDFIREALIRAHFDLIVVDPLFSFTGFGVNDQEHVSHFLRNALNPLLHEYQCGMVVVHHMGKAQMTDLDPVYSAFGSSELSNWCRGMLVLAGTGDREVYRLIAAKNGAATGWCDEDGKPQYEKFIRQHPEHGKPDAVLWSETLEPKGDASTLSLAGQTYIGSGRYTGLIAKVIELLKAMPDGMDFDTICGILELRTKLDRNRLQFDITDLVNTGWKRAGLTEPWIKHSDDGIYTLEVNGAEVDRS